MNFGDPELELIDPTPNIHALFVNFDKLFFWSRVASRAVVRWSKRMYSCAGICSYEGGRGGLCDIALSEPLLKLRPRKDLIETLLHEMIHAYLFITCRDNDRDGHGPNFQAHMHRINKFAGLNISIYHDFHEEVKLYQVHWWRCNGPCVAWKPHFGIVRRTCNKAPAPTDFWWKQHQIQCGGTFIKIKEPEAIVKNSRKKVAKSKADITKYLNNNNNNQEAVNNNITLKVQTPVPVLKDSGNIPKTTKPKSNGANAVDTGVFSPKANKPPLVFSGQGQIINGARIRINSVPVIETVRNVWANKKIPTCPNVSMNKLNTPKKQNSSTSRANPVSNLNKHKAIIHGDSPPAKVMKIDDYFKNAASSVLKDVYGQDFKITQHNNDKKLVATTLDLVSCPVCNNKVSSTDINRHLDECLNKEVIETISKDNNDHLPNQLTKENLDTLNNYTVNAKKYQVVKTSGSVNMDDSIMLNTSFTSFKPVNSYRSVDHIETCISESDNAGAPDKFDSYDVNRVKTILKKINYDKQVRKSGNYVIPKIEDAEKVDVGFLPSFLDDVACEIKTPPIKVEPGTSKDVVSHIIGQKCPCCEKRIDKPIEVHLDECLAFFDNNTTEPEEGASTSFANDTIIIEDEDDDQFDETLTLNATGTKLPCPCCLEMIEEANMNNHLDQCLS